MNQIFDNPNFKENYIKTRHEQLSQSIDFIKENKIPFEILCKVASFFRRVPDMGIAIAQIWYNEKENRYFVHIPEHVCSHRSIATYDSSKEFIKMSHSNSRLIMTLKSNGNMVGFFSGVDNRSSEFGQLEGVIGKLREEEQSFKFRVKNVLLDEMEKDPDKSINPYEDYMIEELFDLPQGFLEVGYIPDVPVKDKWLKQHKWDETFPILTPAN